MAQAQVQSSLTKAPLCKNTQERPKSALQKALVSKDHARTWAWATILWTTPQHMPFICGCPQTREKPKFPLVFLTFHKGVGYFWVSHNPRKALVHSGSPKGS